MEFKEVIKKRYSCKKYSDRRVEAEKLDAILNAGRLAPTAKNLLNTGLLRLEYAKSGALHKQHNQLPYAGLFSLFRPDVYLGSSQK